MIGRLAGAALALSAASGCAHGFLCPAKGGPQWRELRTEHFLLRTDRSAGDARALALELERIRDAVAHGLFESPPRSTGLVQVVVLRSSREFDLFADRDSDGLFTLSGWGEPTIVLPGVFDEFQRATIAHEMAHLLTAPELLRQPPWFREGIACYVETVDFRGRGGNVRVGAVPRYRARAALAAFGIGPGSRAGAGGARSLRRLLEERERIRPEDYGLAWALVHFLLNEHPERLRVLQERFAAGDLPLVAWRTAFGEWDLDSGGGAERLESAMAAYFHGKAKAWVFRHKRLPGIPPPAERVLSPAEVHDVRLALPWRNRGRPLPAGARLDEAWEALAEDPGSATAVALLSEANRSDARALAETATRARPDDARNWVLLGSSLPAADLAGRDAAFRRAVAANPDDRFAPVSLGRHLLDTGRPAQALLHAERGVELAPWSVPALAVAADAFEALAQCHTALALLDRAVTLAQGGDRAERAALVERRDRVARACGPRPAPPP